MPMKTPWERKVEKMGLEAAREDMKRIRTLVKKPGLANSDKETRLRVSKMGAESRNKDVSNILQEE